MTTHASLTTTTTNLTKLTTMNVTSEPTTASDAGLINNVAVQITFYSLYSVIFLLGIFGNILVCYIVYSNKAMQTVTNLFITNLALSDIILCVICVPFTPLYTFLGKWIFGSVTCHLVGYAQATSVYVSTLTLTAIAVDRFFVILHPLRYRMETATCLSILAGIWLFSMSVTLPYGVYMQVRWESGRFVCEENWPYDHLESAFGCSTLLMQFVVPFCVIGYCYLRISRRLNERARCKPGTRSARREEADREKKRRTNRMLIAMVTIFGVCWFPLNMINVANDFFYAEIETYFHLLFFLFHSLAMSSTCYNPFLYAWLNENFRKEFKVVLPCGRLRLTTRGYRGSGEQTLETLLQQSAACAASPAKTALQPREPLAAPLPPHGRQENDV